MFFSTITRSQPIIHKNISFIKKNYRQLVRYRELAVSNAFFWNTYISSIYSDIGYMGIKNKFIYEYGNIDYIEFKEIGLYQHGEVIGVIKNDKTIYDIKSPIDDFKIISFNEYLDYESLNKNPEFIDNYIINFTIGNLDLFKNTMNINHDNIQYEMYV